MNPDQVILQHLETHAIPAAAWTFGSISRRSSMGCVGKMWHTPDAPKSRHLTIFDLASLTKVLVTVPLLLKLIDSQKLDPNAPLKEMLPEIRGFPLETATVKQLVSHTSGLEALSPLRTWKLPRETVLQKSLEMQRPKTGIVYSDQGYLVLTYLLEKMFSERIDRVATRELFAPHNIKLTYAPDSRLCAATEIDPNGNLIIGRVHDENTAALEGISGHAGLFGSLIEVTNYMKALMQGKIISFSMLEMMQQEITRETHDARAFGWLIPHENWLGGQNAPADTLGHTGFTGTGIWFSLKTGQCNILLTNRVCPSRETPNDIAGLRRKFNEAAWQ
jgi:CubicO group peptidase (beta-lactamase class C family)